MNPDELRKMIDHWCPPGFDHEPMALRITRAFMNATACVATHNDIAKGERPIRPLSSFPSKVYPWE